MNHNHSSLLYVEKKDSSNLFHWPLKMLNRSYLHMCRIKTLQFHRTMKFLCDGQSQEMFSGLGGSCLWDNFFTIPHYDFIKLTCSKILDGGGGWVGCMDIFPPPLWPTGELLHQSCHTRCPEWTQCSSTVRFICFFLPCCPLSLHWQAFQKLTEPNDLNPLSQYQMLPEFWWSFVLWSEGNILNFVLIWNSPGSQTSRCVWPSPSVFG